MNEQFIKKKALKAYKTNRLRLIQTIKKIEIESS